MALTIPQALKRIDKLMNLVQREFVDEGAKFARSKTPVDTGKLKSSWTTNPSKFGTKSSIDNNVGYSGFVENGSSKNRPAKMAAQAVQSMRSGANNIVRKAVR
tara:strand:+ start:1157 stop:1465 length:309 start_codon:yes stop_codon:yes gene_type:complete